jgi:PKD repeat protein
MNRLRNTILIALIIFSLGSGIGTATPPLLPVANFSTNVSEGQVPLSVQFYDLSENATSIKWDFGNGNSTERNPIYEYLIPGNYTVNMTATNENGTNSKLATITVLELPVFPDYTNPPTDPNHDGLYEDATGDGKVDFDDVVAYYDNMDWIEQNAPVSLFDYNKNSIIDFDDIVLLYNML